MGWCGLTKDRKPKQAVPRPVQVPPEPGPGPPESRIGNTIDDFNDFSYNYIDQPDPPLHYPQQTGNPGVKSDQRPLPARNPRATVPKFHLPLPQTSATFPGDKSSLKRNARVPKRRPVARFQQVPRPQVDQRPGSSAGRELGRADSATLGVGPKPHQSARNENQHRQQSVPAAPSSDGSKHRYRAEISKADGFRPRPSLEGYMLVSRQKLLSDKKLDYYEKNKSEIREEWQPKKRDCYSD